MWIVPTLDSYLVFIQMISGVTEDMVTATRHPTIANQLCFSWNAGLMGTEDGVTQMFQGCNPHDNVLQCVKKTIIEHNGAKASQDNQSPPKHEMIVHLPKKVKSIAHEWSCTFVQQSSNVSMVRQIPGLCLMQGFIITNWAREDIDSGTINKGGGFSPQPPRFNVTSGVGMGGGGISGGVGMGGVGGGIGGGGNW